MSLELKFALFQLVIIVPFLSGNLLSRRIRDLGKVAKRLIIVNLTMLEPPILLWSVWGLALSPEMIYLPVTATFLALAGFFLGKGVVKGIRLKEKTARVYVICSALANQGFTMGGFLCYLFAGEKGLGLSNILLIFFIPFTFLFIFGYASLEGRQQVIRWRTIRDFLFNLRNMPLLAILIAILLQSWDIKRPDFYFPLDLFLTVAIAIYYFTLGVNFKLTDLNPFRLEHLSLAIQKFVILPALAFLISRYLPVTDELKMIIKIESFMPVAVYAVISSLMFDLDSRRASGMFVVNSLVFIFLVFPVIFFARSILF